MLSYGAAAIFCCQLLGVVPHLAGGCEPTWYLFLSSSLQGCQ